MELILKSEFARRANITRQAASKLTKEGKQLWPAVIDGKVDIDHEVVRAYAKERSLDLTAPDRRVTTVNVGGRKKTDREAVTDSMLAEAIGGLPASDTDVADFQNMTLRQLREIFATDTRFKDWMGGLKTLTDIKDKELNLMKKAGQLVDRQLVVAGVFEPFDSSFRRILADSPRAIATKCVAMVKAGSDESEIEELVRDQLSSQIAPAKAKAVRTLTQVATEGTSAA